MRVATGLVWAPDTTASDTRCVYDPGTGSEFVAVDVCADGTRVPAGDGFGCRLPAGGVFAATERDGALVTLVAAAVPAATTADAVATALAEQLTLLD